MGAAIVPTTALLLPGVSERLPDGIGEVVAAAGAALSGLRPFDVAVLLTAASPAGIRLSVRTTLAGIGRPDLTVDAEVDRDTAEAIATAWPIAPESGWAVATSAAGGPEAGISPGGPVPAGPAEDLAVEGAGAGGVAVPVGLAVLAALVRRAAPGTRVVPVAVSPDAGAQELLAAGESIAAALEGRRAVVVASGDLSAGLSAKGPLALVEGAGAWEDELVDVVAGGRLERVARMGPAEAGRVGALGWAPLVVLAGVCRAAALGLVVRHHAAPRGVGYLVAAGG